MIYHNVSQEQIVTLVLEAVKKVLAKPETIPTGISVRHIHLERRHVEALFGPGYQLTFRKALSQPGQFAVEETLDIIGPKGTIKNVRSLGPERPDTQIEVAYSDARKLGVKAPVRASGDIEGTPGICLSGPAGIVNVEKGVIIADRHIHMTPEDAARFGVSDGELVAVKIEGVKSGIMENVIIRVSDRYRLDFHIDTDDGNAFMMSQGQEVTLIKKQDGQ